MRKFATSPDAGSTQRCSSGRGFRQLWARFIDVTFISQAAEDEQLAEIERIGRERLSAESAALRFSPAPRRPPASS